MLQLVCENIIKKDEKTESVKTEEFEGPNCTLKNRKLHRRRERAPPQSPPLPRVPRHLRAARRPRSRR
jgi:hypothetical protein